MTLIQLVILPGILIALFLGGVFWLLLRLARHGIMMMKAEKAAAEAPVRLLGQQGNIIADVIAEIQASSLEGDIRKDLYDQLLEVNGSYTDYERRK